MDLSITNLEQERQRRQIDHIARLARSGGQLPQPEFRIGKMLGTRGTDIRMGPLTISLDWTELGGDWKEQLTLRIPNDEVEEKLQAIFPDPHVVKKLYDHIFESFEEKMGKENVKILRYGDTKFCG